MKQNPFQKPPMPPDQLFNSYDRGLYRITGQEETDSILDMMATSPGQSNAQNVQLAGGDVGSGVTSGSTAVATGSISAAKTTFDNSTPGYILGVDPNDGLSKFYIGNSTTYLDWTGSGLVVSGTLTASSIAIPNSTTANSFHVDSSGNAWWGATTLAGSVASVLDTGVASFTKITINGGSSAVFISNTLNTSAATILTGFTFSPTDYSGAFTSGTITWDTTTGAITGGSGIIMYKNGIVGAASGAVTFSIDATTGNAAFSGTITASTITGGTLQTAPAGNQFVRIVSATGTLPAQTANSIGVINSSSHLIAVFGSNSGVIAEILPTDSDTGGMLIQNDSGLVVASTMLEVDTQNASSTGTTLSVSQAGSGPAVSISASTTTPGSFALLEMSGGTALRTVAHLTSAFNSNNTLTIFSLAATGTSGNPTVMNMSNAGLGYGVTITTTNASNLNESLKITSSATGRVVSIIDIASSNTNAILYLLGNNGAIASVQFNNVNVPGTTHFWKVQSLNGVTIYASDGALTPNSNLSGNNAGDFLIGGPGGHPFYATGSGSWTQI